MSKNTFLNVKITKRVGFSKGIYEIYKGQHQTTKDSLLVFVLLNAQSTTIQQIKMVDLDNFQRPFEDYYVNKDYYFVFKKPNIPTFKEYFEQNLNQLTEEIVWHLLKQFVQIIVNFKQKSLVINSFDTDYIYYDINEKQVHFISIQSIIDSDDYQKFAILFGQHDNLEQTYFDQLLPHQFDIYQIGKIIINLMLHKQVCQIKNVDQETIQKFYLLSLDNKLKVIENQYSNALIHLLKSMIYQQSNIRIQPEILQQHPIMFTDEQKNSIINYTEYEFKLADFRTVKKLGEGTYGTCDLCVFIPTGEQVVLKQTLQKQSSDVECQILQKIAHPNIVQLYGSFTDGRVYYMILQYCEGGDLFQLLTQERNKEEDQIFRYISQLASAIYYLHSQRLIHRDIKPQNILISNNQMLFADFGVSKQLIDDNAITVVGTPLYFSPEQYFQEPYDRQSDIFALGLVFINISLGSHPFKSAKADIQRFFTQVQQQGNIDKFCTKIKIPEIQEIVSKMLLYDKTKRLTAEEICKYPTIMHYLKLQNLPGPRLHTFFFNQRIVKSSNRLPECFQLINGIYELYQNKFTKYQQLLGKYFYIAQQLFPQYIYQKYTKNAMDENAYSQYLCLQKVFSEVYSKQQSKQHQLLYDENKQILTICDFSNSTVFKVCPYITDFALLQQLSNRETQQLKKLGLINNESQEYIFTTTILVTPALLIQQNQTIQFDNLFIYANNIIIENDTEFGSKCLKLVLIYNKIFSNNLKDLNKKNIFKLINKQFQGQIEIFNQQNDLIQIDCQQLKYYQLTQLFICYQELYYLLQLLFFCYHSKFYKNGIVDNDEFNCFSEQFNDGDDNDDSFDEDKDYGQE